MKNIIEFIEDATPFKVDEKKLFAWLYENKISADRMYFKLITCSRLDRDNFFDSFNEYSIYKEREK